MDRTDDIIHHQESIREDYKHQIPIIVISYECSGEREMGRTDDTLDYQDIIEEIYHNELPVRVLNHESSGERARYLLELHTCKMFHCYSIIVMHRHVLRLFNYYPS